jgi:hypothetical protein
LVIDEPGVFATNEHVLTLEVAMHEAARQTGQAAAEALERLVGGVVFAPRETRGPEAAHEVVEEVVLLPLVERLVELRLQLGVIGRG